jgi:GNAT superfamily N-acetyltransferase|tara:strand:- start:40 stop:477 length:438 start_codon:yes stop_codon:yes gene_type:complete
VLSIATNDDLAEVCDLLRVMHDENGIGRVNEEKALGVISSHIEEGGCIISRSNGDLVGSVGIYQDTWWYSDEKAFFDRWFFVHPEHRTGGHAVRLLGAIKQAARNESRPFVLHVGTTVNAWAKLKFFRKHLTPFGGSFVYMPEAA